jgi:hypothetical protein
MYESELQRPHALISESDVLSGLLAIKEASPALNECAYSEYTMSPITGCSNFCTKTFIFWTVKNSPFASRKTGMLGLLKFASLYKRFSAFTGQYLQSG